MKKQQTGEVMLAMMVVMLVIVLLSHGHMGMMGHGSDHADGSAGNVPPATAGQTQNPAPSWSAEHLR